jgi:hypothetical protein
MAAAGKGLSQSGSMVFNEGYQNCIAKECSRINGDEISEALDVRLRNYEDL